jgi:hypothetical protein
MKRRGRPRRYATRALQDQDENIARTVAHLTLWGFPQRRRVYPVVARVAATLLGRVDERGRPLGPDRIEQIFEHWKRHWKAQGPYWPADPTHTVCPVPPGRAPLHVMRSRYAKGSLRGRVPDKTLSLEELTNRLLQNDGNWPEDLTAPFVPHGDLELTPKAHREYLATRVTLKF